MSISSRLVGGSQNTPSYALLSDAPPLQKGGNGCHVLGWNWAQAMGDGVSCVLTHPGNRNLDRKTIKQQTGFPYFFLPDLIKWPLAYRFSNARIRLEQFLLRLEARRAAAFITSHATDRIFAFFGSNGHFLRVVDTLGSITRLPVDVYLVDDLEESARLSGRPDLARRFKAEEWNLLRKAGRIFAISPGYCEHLHEKYGVNATWLPTATRTTEAPHQPFHRTKPDIRRISFLGSVNSLYADTLKAVVKSIRRWNQSSASFKLEMQIMTYEDEGLVRQMIGAGSETVVLHRLPDSERLQRLLSSWAVLLVYSFEPDMRTMVSTSFATKLMESLGAGRPLIVVGPAYASIPRYFRENHLPLAVEKIDALDSLWSQLENIDSPATIARYGEVLQRFHSPAAIRQIMQAGLESD
jgi:hypothetical protein